ncbi:MAG TPA: hypothetical protein VK400_00045 [Pyrinomonadaceae bacterium]|nr:hypothetical protein [Pyrinomonadaceae bacterium]
MTNQNAAAQQPLVVLISKEEREESFFKRWLEENESSIREANDIFQVIEEINDFTLRECPGVFLLEVETASQHNSVEEMFYISSDTASSEIQIVAYSETIGGGGNNQNAAFSIGA